MSRHSQHIVAGSGDYRSVSLRIHPREQAYRPLRPTDNASAGPQTRHVLRILAPLDVGHRTQANKRAQALEVLVGRPPPPHRKEYERGHDGREGKISFEGEDAGHEDLENHDTPHKTDKGDWPSLTLRLVGFVED